MKTNTKKRLWSKAYRFHSEPNSSLGAYLSFSLDPILKIISLTTLGEKEACCWKSEVTDNGRGGGRIIKSKYANKQNPGVIWYKGQTAQHSSKAQDPVSINALNKNRDLSLPLRK